MNLILNTNCQTLICTFNTELFILHAMCKTKVRHNVEIYVCIWAYLVTVCLMF